MGGALGMVPADSKIIKVEKILKVDPDSQLLASIMAKKLAVDSKYILIDIPYGKSAKVNKTRAEYLKKQFERLGKHFKRRLKVVLTDGRQPIGNGVGPVLELLDVINILDPKKTGPEDLEKKSAFLAGELLEMTGKAKKNQGEKMAQEILCSGKAFEKFKEIIKAQKGQIKNLEPAKFRQKIKSKKSGTIKEIDNKKINALARVAGCPADKTAGIYLLRHVGDKIKKGDTLLTLYSKSKNRLNEAVKLYKKEKPIR
jgi:thymidine phosphorylase